MAVYSDEKIEFFDRAKRDKSYKMHTAHFHNKHELYILEKGRTKYFVDNEIYLLSPGDMLFVEKGAFHQTDNYDGDSYERILLVFDDEFAGREYSNYIEELKRNRFVKIPADKLYKFKEIIAKIEHENRHKSKDYLELQRLYLRELLLFISRYRTIEEKSSLNDSYRLIEDCAGFISRNFSTDLSLDMLAKKYSLSKSYFSKLFKKVTGVGLSEYINISRISAAEKLLLSGEKNITEIALKCGFNDSNYFATVFKKIKGVAPKKYSLSV